MDSYIAASNQWTKHTANVPSFVFLLLSGAIAQAGIGWMHRKPAVAPAPGTAGTAPGVKRISRQTLEALRAKEAREWEKQKAQ